MPEEVDDELNELIQGQEGDSALMKKLRNKLKESNNQLKNRDEQIRKAQEAVQRERVNGILAKTRLDGLNDLQSEVLRGQLDKVEGDLTPETVTSIASQLGFTPASPSTTDPSTSDPSTAPPQDPPPAVNEAPPPGADTFNRVQQANQTAVTGGDGKTLQQKMRETKTPAELRSLIVREGKGANVVHESEFT